MHSLIRQMGTIFFLLVFPAASAGFAKERPTTGKEYEFLSRAGSLKQKVSPAIVVWSSSLSFERVKFEFKRTKDQAGRPDSSTEPLSVPEPKVVVAVKKEGRLEARVEVPTIVQKNGEYFIPWTASLMREDEVIGSVSGTLAVLAEGGEVWIGADAVENAYLEKLKAEHGVEGQPRGRDLAKINKAWSSWMEKRQKKARPPAKDQL